MLLPDGPTTPPTTLLCDQDVETMASVRDYMSEAYLYVTSGPELVAKYQFQRRYPFTIGDTTFLGEGVTEEQHREAIKGDFLTLYKIVFQPIHLILTWNRMLIQLFFIYVQDLVGGHPIVCSNHMLEIMFNEPQLLIVFRVALELEKVYAETEDDVTAFPRVNVDDVIDMVEGVTDYPKNPHSYDPYDEGTSI